MSFVDEASEHEQVDQATPQCVAVDIHFS